MSRILPLDWVTPYPIEDYLNEVAERGGTDGTLHSYRGTLNLLAWWLEAERGVDLLSATEAELHAWRSALTVGYNTAILRITIMKGFYHWAHGSELIPRDPSLKVRTPKLRKRRPRPMAESTLELAIELAPARIRVWLVLAGYAGLRCCEIAALTLEDVYEIEGAPYVIVHGKGDKERVVPLSPFVWAELQWFGLPRFGGHFFRHFDGRPCSANYVSKTANDWLRSQGISDTFHACRHRFGTQANAAEGDLRVVQELLGHADPRTTAIYTAVSDPKKRTAVDAVQPKVWPSRQQI